MMALLPCLIRLPRLYLTFLFKEGQAFWQLTQIGWTKTGAIMYKISDAARRAILTVKTVRYYADIGLVKPAGRSAAGYRLYAESDIAKLTFIGRARRYIFSIEQCRDLLSLYEDDQRPSAEVKRITLEKIADIDRKLGELQGLRDELSHLAGNCHGDSRPDCPIIGNLASGLAVQ